MQPQLAPFNLGLLIPTPNDVRNLRPIKVLDIFDGMSKNFHSDGLFSIETFGKVGDARRNQMFGYINLGIEVFHPVIFKSLVDLKSLYKDILAGKAYAIFDEKLCDFVAADATTGSTGFSFFVSHYKKLKFEQRPSPKREFNIKLINKERENSLFDMFIVMPAGLRDFEFDQNNRPSEDEINGLYRKVISISGVITNINAKINAEYLDTARYNLQIAIIAVYDYIVNMLDGKSKLIMGKWASRKIYNSTRNVLTSYKPENSRLGGDRSVTTNNTVVGLFQYLRMITPLAVNQIRSLMSNVFTGPNTPAILINPKTLKKEPKLIDPDYYDDWMTFEGIQKTIARFSEDTQRHEYVSIDGYYPYLVYKGPDNTYKLIQSIDELPDPEMSKYVSPITLTELLYLAVYKESSDTTCFFCRYPVTGFGSVYPSFTYLKTTIRSDIKKELGPDWQPTGMKACEFPIPTEAFHNSVCPSANHLKRLDADFDGDMGNTEVVLTEEARKEIKDLLNSRSYYVGINGKMNFSTDTDVTNLVLACMTGD